MWTDMQEPSQASAVTRRSLFQQVGSALYAAALTQMLGRDLYADEGARRSVYDVPTVLICAASLAILLRWKIPEPALIACAAVAGIVLRRG